MKHEPRLAVAILTATLLLVGAGLAEPVLHEYFDFTADPATAGATDRSADRNEARAPTSAAARPNLSGTDNVHAGNAGSTDSYQLDSNTTRPDEVGYEDPFTPSIPPFKREFAYDTVDEKFELIVSDRSLRPLTIGGSAERGEDQFFADMNLTLQGGVPERVPSVGPATRVLAARLLPAAAFRMERDSADNWFITAQASGSFRLNMHLSIDRRVFGSEFADPEWRDLALRLPVLPNGVQRRARELGSSLGISRNQRPREALLALVSHFRSFAPSEELPQATDAGELLREIALSKKGVCRHRSYAFLVTALALGLPARFVRNEAHAWVEVHDAEIWHRIDLGGAAGHMQLGTQVEVAHVPPTDPLEWPTGSESGSDMAQATLQSSGSARGGQSPNPTGSARTAASQDEPQENAASARTAPSPTAATPPRAAVEASAAPSAGETPFEGTDPPPVEEVLLQGPASHVEVEPHSASAMQGGRVRVSGVVVAEGPCALVRVDILLKSQDQTIPIGTLVTDDAGRYAGEITLPGSVSVGDYQLRVTTHGTPQCGAGTSD